MVIQHKETFKFNYRKEKLLKRDEMIAKLGRSLTRFIEELNRQGGLEK